MAEEQPKVFGAYLLLRALGRGAMGDVWLARPLNPDRGIPAPVVVKRLHGELASKKGFVSRFRHEAAIAVSVDSPHVAKVYDVGAVGETLYIAMEYVPGWPLSKVLEAILESGRHASIASVIDLIAGGLDGLDTLHTAKDDAGNPLGIVHRDISPKNLMVGEDGRMRLIDLGLGKSNAQDWKTRTGVVMGSVGYMPPEQARGERVDARADLYSLAVVCFEMLALRNYVRRGTVTAMMEASATPKFLKPSSFRPDVPEGLDAVLERALAPEKEQRYQTARHFSNALRKVIAPSHTEGGMTSLISDLFGATRQERVEEISSLLALPLPDATDSEPTRVFVMRAGVLPPDQQPTTYEARDETKLVPTVHFVPPPAISSGSFQPGSSHSISPPRRGVSIPVLIGAVTVAAVLGGLVAVLLADRLAPQVEVVTAIPAPERPVLEPKVEQGEARAPPPPEPEGTAVIPPKPRQARKHEERIRTGRSVSPPPAPVSQEALNAELETLRERASALKNGAGDPEKRDALIKYLNQVSAWKQSNNLEGKQRAIVELRARLNQLTADS